MAVNANSYFLANPDVAAAFEDEAYGLSPQDFAEAHFLMHGQNEQRDAPETLDPYFVSNPDVAQSYGDNRYDMTPDDFAQAHYLLYGTEEQRAQPDALNPYFVQNSDVADAYQDNRYDLSPTDFANTHFMLYGKDEQRSTPPSYSNNYVSPIKNASKVTALGATGSTPQNSVPATNQGSLQNLGTFGAADSTRMGAGGANYQSDLIKTLRQSDNDLMSENSGVTKFNFLGGSPVASAGPATPRASSAFNPQVLSQDVASADDVANWNNYSTYRTNSLNAKTPITSFEEWLAGGKSSGLPEPVAPPVYNFGSNDGGGN